MPNADVFHALGFFARRRFLDPETCRRLRETVRAAPSRAAAVRDDERSYDEVDRTSRSTDRADVAPEDVEAIEQRLASVMPEVERHYGITLRHVQTLQFLVYREGDFFGPHSDSSESDDAAEFLRARRVAAVIFLNGEGDPAKSEAYRGGALTLYGVFRERTHGTLGLALEAEEGLLITFPADLVHEVRPVEAGERYTVVTWFADEVA
jgi:predicted 2-oxoglutarate/Fe(II)-dependent dioxygenase YbiX